MATYYWVGGTGTWDAATTTNWSLTSGGSGGGGVPTVNDDVVFNSQSSGAAYTVTINAGVCRNWTLAGPATGNVTVAGTTTMTVAGSVAWATTGITRTFTNTITFTSTTTGKTVDFGGITLANSLTFNGVGGAWAFVRNLTNGSGNTITLTNGALDMRGYAFTTGAIASSGTAVRTLLIDATTTLTLTGTTPWNFGTTTNLTADFTNVTFTVSGSGATFNAGNLSYGTLLFTSVASGTWTVTGNATFNTITYASRTATGTRTIRFGGNITIVNLTLGTANQIIRRLFVGSDTTGVQRTLTVTNLVTALTDIDFEDINIAGTAWSGTRLGDCGNNNNITFQAARTVYWNLPAGGVFSSAAWALTSGGTASVNNFPLPQDTIIFQNTGLNTGATVTIDSDWKFGSIDASTRSNTMTLSHGTVSMWIFGDTINLPSNVTLSGTTGSYIFAGYNKTINPILSTGTHAFPIQFIAPLSTVNLQSNLVNTSTGGIFLYGGTLNMNGYNITTNVFTASSSTPVPRTLAFGNNVVNITGSAATVWSVGTATTLTYTGTPVVNFTYSGATGTRTIGQGLPASGNYPTFNVTGGSDIVSLATCYIDNLNFTGFTGTWTSSAAVFIAGDTTVVPAMTVGTLGGTLNFISMSSNTKMVDFAGKTTDQSITFNGNGGSWALSNNIVAGVTRTLTLSAGTLYANNKNITTGFVSVPNTPAVSRTLNMGSGTWTILGSNFICNTSPTTTINCNTSLIVTTNTTVTFSFYGGGQTFNNMWVSSQGTTDANRLTMYNNCTFNDVTIDLAPGYIGRKVAMLWSSTGEAGSANPFVNINGTLTFTNTSLYNRPFVLNVSGNTTLYVNNAVGVDYTDFRKIHLTGPVVPLDGTRCGDVGGNEGITFAPQKTVYWSQPAGGNWSDTVWSYSSGGTPDDNAFPLAHDDAIIDSNGISNGSVIMLNSSWQLGNVFFTTNNSVNWFFANVTPDVGGSIILGENTTVSGNGASVIYFSPGRRSEVFVDFKNAVIPFRTDFQPLLGGTVTLLSNTTIANSTQFVQGTLNLNNNILYVTNVVSSYTNSRTLAFGETGEIRLTGTGNNTANGTMFIWQVPIANNLTMTGSKIVRGVYNGSDGSRRFDHGTTSGATESNSPNVYIEPGNDSFQYGTGNGASRDFIANVGFTGIIGLPVTIYGSLTQSANSQPTASTITRNFSGTQGPYYIRLNGTTLDRPVVFNGGGTYVLADNYVGGVNKQVILQAGTLTALANVTVSGFRHWPGTVDTVRVLNMGDGTWTITGDGGTATFDGGNGSVWQGGNTALNTNMTVNPGNSTIRMTGAFHKRFNAGGMRFNNLVQAGAGNLRIQHEGKFNKISNEVDGTLVTFLESETFSVANLALSNTTISSVNQSNNVPANTFTLQAMTGRENVTQGLTISYCTATPNGYFYAPTANNNVDAGNNAGWKFESPKTNKAEFIPLIMPSF